MKNKLLLCIFMLFTILSFSQQGNKTTVPESNTHEITYQKITVLETKEGNISLTGNKTQKENSKSFLGENLSSGIGETPGSLSVSLTGSANYNVPIAVPPGINGVVPKIALSYDSQNGNGIAGFGWNISGISTISRIPATKYHDNEIDCVDFDASDRFALDGERLILKSGVYGANNAEYETENYSNLKIVSYGVSPLGANYGPSHFIVYYPDGSKVHYGNSNDSRTQTSYAITYWENPQGLRIDYEYVNNNNSQSISKIKYGHTSSTSPINEIRFSHYSNNRLIWEQAYINDVSLTRNDLLRDIEVFSGNERVRMYTLTHDFTSNSRYNRLTKITEKSGDLQQQHSPIYFNYSNAGNTINYNDIVTDLGLVNIEQRNTETVSLDFTGNGKMDFIAYPKEDKTKFWLFKDIQSGQQTSPWVVNTGSFETIFPTTWLNHQSKVLGEQGLTIVSKGNNGRVHFKVYSNGIAQPIYHQYTKTWDSPLYQYDTNCDTSTQKSIPREYISGDFNGDGLTDVLAIGKPYTNRYCYEYDCPGGTINPDRGGIDVLDPDPGSGSSGTCCSCNDITVNNKDVNFIDLNRNLASNFTNFSGALQEKVDENDRLLTGDFNGDGKTDLLHIKSGKLFVYDLDANNSLNLLWQVNDAGINLNNTFLLGDYNADGKTDFMIPVATNSNQFKTFISTGVRFITETTTKPFTYKNNIDDNGTFYGHNLVPLDINGDGKTDIVEYNTVTYNAHSNGSQTIKTYTNRGLNFNHTTAGNTFFVLTGERTRSSNLKHYPIPIFLTSNQPNKSLDFAVISNQWVSSFSFMQDHREDVLLRSVDTNGVEYTINYSELDAENPSVYQTLSESVYPNIDIRNAPGTKVVTEVNRISNGTPTLKKTFVYQGAVYNAQGLGFLGFKGVARSNWHTDNSDRIYDVYKFDTDLRGAVTAVYSQANYFDFNVPSSNYITKTTTQYGSSLSANKVFKLWTTSTLTQNALDGTYTNTSYQYDIYNNPTHISTNYVGGSTSKSITYSNNTGINYYIGRPENSISNSIINGEIFNSEEQFSYTGYLLTEKRSRGNGTPYNVDNYEYDTFGNVTKIITTPYGEASREVNLEYDISGRYLTKSIDVEGLEVTYDHQETTGSLLKETNPFGQETNYEYDVWNRLVKVTDYLGNEVTTVYDEDNYNSYSITSISDDGSESEVIYDPLKRVTKVREKDILGQWVTKSYVYDKFDRVSKESEPYIGENPSQWNEVAYDFYGRPVTQTLHTGRVISMSYNGTSVTVDDGVKTVTSTNDGMGNTLSVTDPGGTINYTYYGNGSLKSADNGGSVVSVEQDGWGRKTKLTDPSAGIFEYAYNGYGELISETNPKGITNYTYSPIGKLLEEHITGDHTDMLKQYNYHPTNKLLSQISVTSSDGNNSNHTYTYDVYQRLIETSEVNPYANFSKEYTYDAFGRVDTEKYHAKLLSNNKTSTKQIKNTYQNGGLKTIADFNTNQSIWSITGVNARGQLTSASLGNTIQSSNSYDIYGYLTNKVVSENSTSTSQILMNLSTSFDTQRGTLNSRSNSLFSWSETFEYDNLDRLITFNDNNGNNTLTYDDKGRITNNSSIGDYNYSGTSYQVANIDLNNQGDLYYQQNDLQQIKYNAFKKPYEINEEGKEKIGFQYNAFMGRSHMFYGGTENDILQRNNRKHYAADGSMEISYDTNTDTTLFVTYIGGDAYSTPIIWRSEQQSFSANEDYFYLHRDYLGSIILITDADGNAKEKRHFDAWGNIVKLTDGNDVALDKLTFLDRGYTGHEHLHGVKLVHMNGRLYDPKLKRFLSPDNYIQNTSNTQNFNRYSYVLNNPLMYVDPSGEMTEESGSGWLPWIANGIGSAYNSLEGTDFRGFRNWVGTNFQSAVDDVSGFFRGIGRSFKRLFGGGKKSAPVEMNSYTNLTSDPLAGTTSGNSISLYDGSGGSNIDYASYFGNKLAAANEAVQYYDYLMDHLRENTLKSSYEAATNPTERRRLGKQLAIRRAIRSDSRVREFAAPTDAIGIILHFGTLGIGSQLGLGLRTLNYATKYGRNISAFSYRVLSKTEAHSVFGGMMNLLPEGSLANHVFSGKTGKFLDNFANRELITNLANNSDFLKGVDQYGKSWYAMTLKNGTQIYAYTHNGIIKGAGFNLIPRTLFY